MMPLHRRCAAVLLPLIFLGIATLGVGAARLSILRAVGWILVANDQLDGADAVVIAIDADGAGVLEAADLVHSGAVRQVAVFADAPDVGVDNEFIRRGIPYETRAERSIRELRGLGVDAIDRIPGYVAGTEDEGPALANCCDKNQFRSILVVSTADHSRRLRRMLRRAMRDHQTRVIVRSARYTVFDPDRWWESHGGVRTEIEELEKLLLDIARHPIL